MREGKRQRRTTFPTPQDGLEEKSCAGGGPCREGSFCDIRFAAVVVVVTDLTPFSVSSPRAPAFFGLASAETPEDMPEMSEFSHSEFMNSEFNTSHMGTEYSMYESSALAEEEGGEAGGRAVGTGEWTRHQQSQNSSQFTSETDRDNPWKNSGRDLSGRDLPGERGVVAAAGQGRVGAFTGDDGRLHDLPPLGGKVLAPSSHSVLSHDLSGFSDFDSVPSKYNRDDSGDITAPHPAPSDRRNWKRAGLTEAAALAADADAQNLVRQKQREREAAEAAAEKKRAALRTERKAAATAGVGVVPGPDGSGGSGGSAKRPPGARAGGAAVRDTGDMKDEDESQGGMSEFRASTLEVREGRLFFPFFSGKVVSL